MKVNRTYRSTYIAMGLMLTVLSTGCANKNNEDTALEYREAIGYDYNKTVVSAQQEVLFQNDAKTIIYQATYLPDVTAENAAAKFESDTKYTSKKKTTWEQAMWEYNSFCYNHQYEFSEKSVKFSSPEWDLDLWQFTAEDTGKTSTTETLFVDREDGCYSIAMTYPTADVNAKNTVYYLAISQEFQIDHDHIQKTKDGLKWEWGKNEQGDLVITVKNNGEETAECVNCRVKANTPPETREDGAECSGFANSFSNDDLLPGETATFTIEAEKMKDVTDYTVDTYLYYALRKIDLNGEVWTIDK